MFKVFIVLLCSIISINCLAICPQPVQLIEKDEKANCRGYLFSPEKESELYLMKKEYDILKQEVQIKDKYIDLLKKDVTIYEEIVDKEREKSDLWRNAAEEASAKVIKLDEGRGNRDLLFLSGGILLTILAGWSVGQVSK